MGYLQSKFLHPLGEKKRAQKHPLNPFVYRIFGPFREINFTDSGINNKIDTAAVDQFATAMGKRNVKKGVFITTSSFVQPVIDEYAHPVDGKTIRLIDGDELMNYLIKYEIGVKSVKTYTTYKLDENYFIST